MNKTVTPQEFIDFLGNSHLYIGNIELFHNAVDLFDIPNNTGLHLRENAKKLWYRIEKLRKQDSRIIKGFIKHGNGFGKYRGETNHTAYWIKKEDNKQ